LVPVLALSIDLCRAARLVSPGRSRLREANLNALLAENPHASQSRHVLHNIGPARARWLAEYRASQRHGEP
jgi:hypothetical protein